MLILGIETSCDDTGVAILEADRAGCFNVLANIVASQIEVHKKYGGVYPFLAKREHQKNLPITFKRAFKKAGIFEKDIDLTAVTSGPGLEPCLWVGVTFAKDLAKKLNVPLIPVNHIESHILVNFLDKKNIIFPAICLVVSGGHTQLILMRGIGNYKILGETRDDAAGECFDKCAKLLGLGYPGGPIISKLAQGQTSKNIFPRPMMHTKDYDFSFSGLKTAVLYYLQKNKNQNKKQMAVEVQRAIIDVLLKKTIKATKDYRAKTIILGGGVSANAELRKQFKKAIKNDLYGFLPNGKNPYATNFLVPPTNLSTDNALMATICAYFHRTKKIAPSKLKANANLRID